MSRLLCWLGFHQKHFKSILRYINAAWRCQWKWEARWICGRPGCMGFGVDVRRQGHWRIVDNKIVPDRQAWADGKGW